MQRKICGCGGLRQAGDPPVKAIISVGRQVLLELVVGLLYFPAEVFQLAVERVFQGGREVAVHRRTTESSGD